ncbi:MAG TPA: response regulator [Sandaracinaceae bacterium]
MQRGEDEFVLEAERALGAHDPDEEQPTSLRLRGAPRLHLLFVDDDPLAEMTLRRAFRRLGIEAPLSIAHDGLEALELLRDPWFPAARCVVLLDLNMPRMDGHELLRELRASPDLSRVPVVVMTTSDDARDVQQAYAGGAAGYFVKPASFTEFVAQVEALIAYWSRAVLPPAGGSSLLPIP